MKSHLVFILCAFSLVFGQSANFRYDIYNDSEIHGNVINISKLSSLWLSDQLSTLHNDRQKLVVQFGYSTYSSPHYLYLSGISCKTAFSST